MYTLDELKPGDCLLYSRKGIFGWVIMLKTWHTITHCEVYIGKGQSVASRDGIGVGQYPTNLSGLVKVLRPNRFFHLQDSIKWFDTEADGRKYDWRGLFRFIMPDGKPDDERMFCSEFVTCFYRRGGLKVLSNEPADAVAPFMFELDEDFDLIQPSSLAV